jgi:hypothetical protein
MATENTLERSRKRLLEAISAGGIDVDADISEESTTPSDIHIFNN